MKTIPTILLILMFCASFAVAQTDSKKLWISGKVKVLAGLEVVDPLDAFAEIEQLHKLELIDPLGRFRFDYLMPGDYKIKIHGLGYSTLDTLISIRKESVKDLQLLIVADCEVSRKMAELDIKNGKPNLLLIGGIAPVVYMDQYKFEEKYDIEYKDYGCTPPAQECVEQYNKRIFEHLDSRYGKSWRKKVRKDVIGLK
ncbi:hypothetical protein OKW21_000633 [Catalinimonas alkaloidigena]|uniref:FEKKY domain-containing protein n=1 Tax=Catalinimonas alkaloidigena TaxID=1075417 RepID=UPI002406464E|nr:hypothetical protein [Catalinimonas alkaloidigena]MDF9795370.1 hypothetical protein [Catalinimonas alkaloidigena]